MIYVLTLYIIGFVAAMIIQYKRLAEDGISYPLDCEQETILIKCLIWPVEFFSHVFHNIGNRVFQYFKNKETP